MAAKVFAFFALLALSVNAATAYISPVTAAAGAIPLYSPQATAIAATHPCVQYYAQLQALASGILAPSAVFIQQPLAMVQQQCQAHLAAQSIIALQHQQQMLVNPAATLLQNMFNQVALANPITAYRQQQQQQQLLQNVFNQVAMTSPITYWQQQQLLSNVFNQVALANPIIAAYWQQPQLLPNVFNQVAIASPVTYWQTTTVVKRVQPSAFGESCCLLAATLHWWCHLLNDVWDCTPIIKFTCQYSKFS
ncbi:hypothetical protein PVAP13_9KG441300 [Panicum virgatum]|uniref:Uncharacterized protein n=1 Tax=Panicum virgatum TaxID=38727 RepID=A0A8T0NVC0_PANVG|nr:hypothetical protein PVAP13_9KG441300 [Panicum virgatum]